MIIDVYFGIHLRLLYLQEPSPQPTSPLQPHSAQTSERENLSRPHLEITVR